MGRVHSEDFTERRSTRTVVRVHSEDFAERAELTWPVGCLHPTHRHTAVTATPLVGWVHDQNNLKLRSSTAELECPYDCIISNPFLPTLIPSSPAH